MIRSLRTLSIAVITLAMSLVHVQAAEDAMQRWAYYQEIELPADESQHFDLLLPVSVFDGAREDLADLRIVDAAGAEVPYALRILERKSVEEQVEAETFNEAQGPQGSSQLSLKLSENRKGHNRVDIELEGENFRRAATVEGSDDGENWVELATAQLLRFEALEEEDTSVDYSSSSFRYLRIRVHQDPQVDEEPVPIKSVKVLRRLDLPGEYVTREATLSTREAVRTSHGPGSAWRIDLGGKHVPVRHLFAHVAEADFDRDYELQVATDDRFFPYETLTFGNWEQLPTDANEPQAIDLDAEHKLQRLRLLVSDHANPPLSIDRVTYSAAARQIVWANTGQLESPLRLYFGNPEAPSPEYDFARNLPLRLAEKPVRLEAGERQDNPEFVPPAKALTERWPWLVHVVLGLVCLVLAAIIVSIARATIRLADEAPAAGQPAR